MTPKAGSLPVVVIALHRSAGLPTWVDAAVTSVPGALFRWMPDLTDQELNKLNRSRRPVWADVEELIPLPLVRGLAS